MLRHFTVINQCQQSHKKLCSTRVTHPFQGIPHPVHHLFIFHSDNPTPKIPDARNLPPLCAENIILRKQIKGGGWGYQLLANLIRAFLVDAVIADSRGRVSLSVRTCLRAFLTFM
ncbi:uncharacterized protein METZ01_LOCUS307038 [marine metagenome]|uniref:Uncharacterized protein n=1 Tax=marine metagenome TaxID=408172 RepID=A0A382MYX7_9ZZZZ